MPERPVQPRLLDGWALLAALWWAIPSQPPAVVGAIRAERLRQQGLQVATRGHSSAERPLEGWGEAVGDLDLPSDRTTEEEVPGQVSARARQGSLDGVSPNDDEGDEFSDPNSILRDIDIGGNLPRAP